MKSLTAITFGNPLWACMRAGLVAAVFPWAAAKCALARSNWP